MIVVFVIHMAMFIKTLCSIAWHLRNMKGLFSFLLFLTCLYLHTVPEFHSQPMHTIIFQQDGTPNLEIEFEVCRNYCDDCKSALTNSITVGCLHFRLITGIINQLNFHPHSLHSCCICGFASASTGLSLPRTFIHHHTSTS